jgi:hypothetical protein
MPHSKDLAAERTLLTCQVSLSSLEVFLLVLALLRELVTVVMNYVSIFLV